MSGPQGRAPVTAIAVIKLLAARGPMTIEALCVGVSCERYSTVAVATRKIRAMGYVIETVRGTGVVPSTYALNPKRKQEALDWAAAWDAFRESVQSRGTRVASCHKHTEKDEATRIAPRGFVERAMATRTELERLWLGR